MQAHIDEECFDRIEPFLSPENIRNERRLSTGRATLGRFNASTQSLAISDTPGDNSFTTEALVRSGLSTGDFHTYGIPYVPFRQADRLQEAVDSAQRYLCAPHTPRDGLALVDMKILNAHLIVMSNLIPALADLEGRRYTERLQACWRTIIGTLWVLLRSQRGLRHEVSGMVSQIRQALIEAFQGSEEGSEVGAFLQGGQIMSADLDTLLKYVVYVCHEHDMVREEGSRVVREARQASLAVPRTESTRSALSAFPEMGGYRKRSPASLHPGVGRQGSVLVQKKTQCTLM